MILLTPFLSSMKSVGRSVKNACCCCQINANSSRYICRSVRKCPPSWERFLLHSPRSKLYKYSPNVLEPASLIAFFTSAMSVLNCPSSLSADSLSSFSCKYAMVSGSSIKSPATCFLELKKPLRATKCNSILPNS